MATTKELETRVRQLEALLAQVGLSAEAAPPAAPEERADYIAFGSPEHAAFLGLILLDDEEQAEERVTYRSRATGQLYCLEDERGAMYLCPAGLTLREAATIVLREKVSAFESGPVTVPEDAPPMWTPTPTAAALASLR